MSIQQTTWRRWVQAVRWLSGQLAAGILLTAGVGGAQDSPPAARPGGTR
ncbi:MAG: hypothetical protein J5I93_27265 [Pirellulaceae bacterium]|nr:hypothetical protein [Pirellulaceae bacterium]